MNMTKDAKIDADDGDFDGVGHDPMLDGGF